MPRTAAHTFVQQDFAGLNVALLCGKVQGIHVILSSCAMVRPQTQQRGEALCLSKGLFRKGPGSALQTDAISLSLACPAQAAKCRGVLDSLSLELTSCPAASSFVSSAKSPSLAALCKSPIRPV